MNYVPAVGPTDAKIVIVGEAPGAEEDRAGLPFVGYSGRLLTELLTEAGIRRADCYITNVVKVRPPNNDIAALSSDEMQFWLRGLYAELRGLTPNVIVALGATALKALYNESSITKLRGSILTTAPKVFNDGQSHKLIATFHPAAILRQYNWRQVALTDFKRIAVEAQSPALNLPNRHYIIEPSYQETLDYLDYLTSDKCPRIAFDIETVYQTIRCIGFAGQIDEAICIPFYKEGGSYWTSHYKECEIWAAIGRLFKQKKQWVAHNAMFDCSFLARFYNLYPAGGIYMDTMLAQHACYSELPKALDFITSLYTREPYYKDEGREWKKLVDWRQFWIYNCKDAVVTLDCSYALDKEVKDNDVERIAQHAYSLIEPLLVTSLRGVYYDRSYLEAFKTEVLASIDEHQAKLNQLVGKPINVSSSKQMTDLLYKQMKLKPKHNRKTGNVSADVKSIEALAAENPSPLFHEILTVRKYRKLYEDFISKSYDLYDKRMRCEYKIAGTKTGRLASAEYLFMCGGNLQNIPHGKARNCFTADCGKVIAYSDLKQAEAVVVDYLIGDFDSVVRRNQGGDSHTDLAVEIWNIDPADARKEAQIPFNLNHYSWRHIAKTARHATNYMIGAKTLSMNLQIPETEAARLIAIINERKPLLHLWHERVLRQITDKRFMVNCFGRKRYFFDRIDTRTQMSAVAWEPQGTIGDLLNYGLIAVYKELGDRVDILLQVHDAIVWQADEAIIDALVEKVERRMIIPIILNDRQCVIGVDTKLGYTWGEVSD